MLHVYIDWISNEIEHFYWFLWRIQDEKFTIKDELKLMKSGNQKLQHHAFQ